jgi:hypothetical protein
MIFFLLFTLVFIYLNFFIKESKNTLLTNTSECLLSYKPNFIILECENFFHFYHFYLKNIKNLFVKKIKIKISTSNDSKYTLIFEIDR